MSSVASGVGGLISGGVGSLLGGAASAAGSLLGGNATNDANRDIASAATASNIAQSDTTFQRSVADLKAAGLNPVLAAGGATDPVGQAETATLTNAMGTAMQAGIGNFSSLQSARQTDPAIENTASQTNLNNALIAKAAADTTSALSSSQATLASIPQMQANTRAANASASKTESGSLLSDVIGSTAAAKGSQYLNSAIDNATSKVSSLISNITNSSAYKAVSPAFLHPIDSIMKPFQ
jgi:hypothetical protein